MISGPNVQTWHSTEVVLHASGSYKNAYRDVAVYAEFTHSAGACIRRPAFWDGGSTWRVRFTSPGLDGVWQWETFAEPADPGLHHQCGSLMVSGTDAGNRSEALSPTFWRMSPGGRSLVDQQGQSHLLVADTAWALPWRATEAQVKTYAAYRQAQGFNAALLMVVQPDLPVAGPEDRTVDDGFARGFDDLSQGRLEQLRPDYFQQLDRLVAILQAQGIVPVYNPVFHGYGWRGGPTIGRVVSEDDYARFARYLVARYGAAPAIWLVGADGHDFENLPSVDVAGREIEAWDDYHHPTGLHHGPHGTTSAYQDRSWLDFQWCQTGHFGEHLPDRVASMWRDTPAKGVANGEPTYENMAEVGCAAGWWQGHEAWSNLCAGGTMGIVYGAASLWQWRHRRDATGDADWCICPGADWQDALRFEGARYVGNIRKIFDGLSFADMQPNTTWTHGRRGLAVDDSLFIAYLPRGGGLKIITPRVPPKYRIYAPKTGDVLGHGDWSETDGRINTPKLSPAVVVCQRAP